MENYGTSIEAVQNGCKKKRLWLIIGIAAAWVVFSALLIFLLFFRTQKMTLDHFLRAITKNRPLDAVEMLYGPMVDDAAQTEAGYRELFARFTNQISIANRQIEADGGLLMWKIDTNSGRLFNSEDLISLMTDKEIEVFADITAMQSVQVDFVYFSNRTGTREFSESFLLCKQGGKWYLVIAPEACAGFLRAIET